MEFSIKSGSPEKQRTPCVVIPIFRGRKLSRPATALDAATNGAIKQFLRRGDIDGRKGEHAWLYQLDNTFCDRVLLIGCGNERDIGPREFNQICSHTAQVLDNSGATEAVSYLCGVETRQVEQMWMVRATVLAMENALYSYDVFKSSPSKSRKPLRKVTISINRRKDLSEAEKAMREGMGMATGMRLAKDLGNTPPNICNPSYLVAEAERLQKTYPKMELEVLEEEDMANEGMNSFLSVSKGSEQPGKLICMRYNTCNDPDSKPIVLIGKGITFDTGGISIKPSAKMDEMKYDMCGAAGVMGTLVACMDMQLDVNLVVIVAAAENMPDGRASRPGDIVTTMSGQTVEILNTDAEGRLVLCDALTYASKYNPSVVIDVATLTGACITALGHHISGMISHTPGLARELESAGKSVNDRVWELPMMDEHHEQLDSNFADIANIGGPAAGTITAGCFLSKFAKDYRWAHIDIAGTAWKSGKEKGATGRPVPLLTEFILSSIPED